MKEETLSMNWKQTCSWFVLAVVISCNPAATLGETVTATVGAPYILRFDYDGPRLGVTFRYRKDGQPFVPERFIVFRFLGRLSFIEITDTDAGLYELEVEGRGIHYSGTVNLQGM